MVHGHYLKVLWSSRKVNYTFIQRRKLYITFNSLPLKCLAASEVKMHFKNHWLADSIITCSNIILKSFVNMSPEAARSDQTTFCSHILPLTVLRSRYLRNPPPTDTAGISHHFLKVLSSFQKSAMQELLSQKVYLCIHLWQIFLLWISSFCLLCQ